MNLNNATSPNIIELEAIHIATPCRANWNQMRGDDQIRHCTACAKNVYNLSAMTRDQAQRLIQEKEGNLCVQLHRRADGTVLTSDCTVGISDHKKSRQTGARFLASIFAALLGVLGVQTGRADSSLAPTATLGAPRVVMGEMPPMRGEIGVAVPKAAPKKKGKAVKMPGRNHGNNNPGTRKNRAAKSLGHRRHR